jgi:hypothetical protein
VQFGEGITRSLDGVSGPGERLRTFVLAYLDCARTYPLEHAFIVQSHNLGYASVSDDILRPRRILVDILEAGSASGEFSIGSPQLVAPFIAGGLGRVVALLQSRPDDFDPAEVAATIVDGVDKLVGARPAGERAAERT